MSEGPPWDRAWARDASEVCALLEVATGGLSEAEVKRRTARYGENKLRERKPRPWWSILLAQLKSLIVGILAVAAVLSFFFDRAVEGVAVVAVIVINSLIGFVMEIRAVRSMEALRRLGQVTATVRRSGELQQVPAAQLVPGDVLIVEGGDIVTSDVRLTEANKLSADESALTGESLPVTKRIESVADDAALADRRNMLFKGTIVTRGSGEGVVVATGAHTELGRVAELVQETEDEETPLEMRLSVLGRKLLWLTAVIAILVGGSGFAAGHDVVLIVETVIALAVATVPEGLPVVATLALARGMWRMARRNAVVRRLSAVETLGSTSIILTDKTGTLTENRLAVTVVALDDGVVSVTGGGLSREGTFVRNGSEVAPLDDALLARALRIGVLCNNADLHEDAADDAAEQSAGVGEPLEIAMLVAGAKAGVDADALVKEKPELREEAFDPEQRMMATYHRDERVYVAVKGAPEAVMSACARVATRDGDLPMDREHWGQQNEDLAAKGLRVVAVADKHVDTVDEAPYSELTLVGLVGMTDPPRHQVRTVMEACRTAGIRVVMATGDQPATASRIAIAVGLAPEGSEAIVPSAAIDAVALKEASIVARTSPEQKLRLIEVHQKADQIVAMIGDGVNDAPALRKADIGVAMGQRGTRVARDASDMVLLDDKLDTVIVAVREGRVIFENIRKFVVYLLSCNVSELGVVGLASLVGMPLPLLPLQILFLNLVTDVFPALALGACDGEDDVMRRRPRPAKEELMTRRHWAELASYGVVLTVTVLASLWVAMSVLGEPAERAVTISFVTLGLSQTLHVFNMRTPGGSFWRNEVTRNGVVWGAVAVCVLLMAGAVYLPGLNDVLGTTPPSAEGWLVIAVFSMLPLFAGQVVAKALASRTAPPVR